ncbi:MAG TPA: HipA N-terminal domain-containing protein, partial [Acidimicrobiia bacterium]
MARARITRLRVWCFGVEVAELTADRPWTVRCRYTANAIEEWPGNAPVLSCSLPLVRRKQHASAFFNGVLPEGQHRAALAARAGVAANDIFAMLARYGRDVAGALIVAPEPDDAERAPGVVPYDADQLVDEVLGLRDHPLAVYDDSELSIGGLQDKM